MNRERLEYLITIMERVEKEERKFNMGDWGQNRGIEPVTLCNTVCCAFGSAALDPVCMAEGLHMCADWTNGNNHGWVFIDSLDDLAKIPYGPNTSLAMTPVFGANMHFDAAMAYYDIGEQASHYLFHPSYYTIPGSWIKPHHVIEHIRDILNGKQFPDDDDDDAFDPDDYDPENYDDDDDGEQARPSEGFV
jgi:hypothetical protein